MRSDHEFPRVVSGAINHENTFRLIDMALCAALFGLFDLHLCYPFCVNFRQGEMHFLNGRNGRSFGQRSLVRFTFLVILEVVDFDHAGLLSVMLD